MADSRKPPQRPTSTPAPPSHSPGGLNERLIGERIATLLSFYWTAADPPELRALQANDWLDDLAEFPAAVVAAACAEWRRTEESRRPTPAAIRRLCGEQAGRARPRLGGPPRDARAANKAAVAEASDFRQAKFAEAAAAREAWAREYGYASFGDALKVGLAVVERRGTKAGPIAPLAARPRDVTVAPELLASAAERAMMQAPQPADPRPEPPLAEPPPPELEIEF